MYVIEAGPIRVTRNTNIEDNMSHKINACEFDSAYEAYKSAKARQSRIDERVDIECTEEQREEIVSAIDEDRDGEVENGEVYEMWGTTHTQAGSFEWTIHLIEA